MGKCSNCENKGEHWHHIVPKSRGGSDDPSNLVLLCLSCHSKAHDVSFKSNTGLIKEAVQRTKKDWLTAATWWVKNEDTLLLFFDFLYDEERDYHDFLLSGLKLGILMNDDIYKVTQGIKPRAAIPLKKTHIRDIKELWDGFLESLERNLEQA